MFPADRFHLSGAATASSRRSARPSSRPPVRRGRRSGGTRTQRRDDPRTRPRTMPNGASSARPLRLASQWLLESCMLQSAPSNDVVPPRAPSSPSVQRECRRRRSRRHGGRAGVQRSTRRAGDRVGAEPDPAGRRGRRGRPRLDGRHRPAHRRHRRADPPGARVPPARQRGRPRATAQRGDRCGGRPVRHHPRQRRRTGARRLPHLGGGGGGRPLGRRHEPHPPYPRSRAEPRPAVVPRAVPAKAHVGGDPRRPGPDLGPDPCREALTAPAGSASATCTFRRTSSTRTSSS